MVEELVTSPNAAMQKSPHKTNDEGESRNPMQLKESIDDNLITKGKNLHGHEISSQSSPLVNNQKETDKSLQTVDPDDKEESLKSLQSEDPDNEVPENNVLTMDSLEDALNQQLAELEEDEACLDEQTEKEVRKEAENESEEVSISSVANIKILSKKDDEDDDYGEITEDEAVDDKDSSGQSVEEGSKKVLESGLPKRTSQHEENSSPDSSEFAKEDNTIMETGCEKEMTAKRVLDLEEGLMDLQQIMQNFKNFDETSEEKEKSGLKRSRHSEGNNLAKRTKLEKSDLKKKIAKELKIMSRTELEDLLSEKIVEMISSRSEIGELRQKCDTFQEMNVKWKRKIQALQKMCHDLSTVMKRYITDVQKENVKVEPIKITRSVGLQVLTDHNKRISTPTLVPPQVTTKGSFPMVPRTGLPMIIRTNTAPMSMPNGISTIRQPLRANFVQRPVVAPSPVVMSKRPMTVNIAPTGMRALPVPNRMPIIQTRAPLLQDDGNKKVIDVVDLDDDEGVTPTMRGPVVIPTGQLRLIPTNQLQQQQGQAYALVSSANSTVAGLNRIVIARPQMPSQIMVSRNLNGSVVRAPQPAMSNSRPVVIQAQPRPAMSQGVRAIAPLMHPAPLPEISQVLHPQNPGWKQPPPKPKLKISRLKEGIVLSWNMDLSQQDYAPVTSYQIFAYQETVGLLPAMSLWRKVGDVKALPLPMACTLTQFTKGNKYHFAIRAHDGHGRIGLFSDPQSVSLT